MRSNNPVLVVVPTGETITNRGWTFFVSGDQTPNDLVLQLRDSLSHKAVPLFEMLSQ